MTLKILAGLALAIPGIAQAQANQCVIPRNVATPRPDLPSPDQPKRVLPIGSYTLAITWAPEYCRNKANDRSARFQCGGGNRFGFTLHGLWPDGVGKEWPQYCTATAIVPKKVIRDTLCSTPSPQLIQHEWAKHGTCMQTTPANYFRTSTRLYYALRYPDMNALSRKSLTVGDFSAALSRANPRLPVTSIRVTETRQGWLDEVWLCMDKAFRYERCQPNSGGLPATADLKIWRGRR
ncbi:ribonuclease T [Sphingomonas aliaeris]|uniref:Ribonuclease T n=1 Tax=Sphingomonas aliaeris TaxID=2759526 RepID=A0A974S3K5_9SPHN|nr:ribonuclease T [Sphingomonas aliaeris]QQV76150.1 ribonuclease T [Sphingomonas aliaeris]